jgi:hypothetical protein
MAAAASYSRKRHPQRSSRRRSPPCPWSVLASCKNRKSWPWRPIGASRRAPDRERRCAGQTGATHIGRLNRGLASTASQIAAYSTFQPPRHPSSLAFVVGGGPSDPTSSSSPARRDALVLRTIRLRARYRIITRRGPDAAAPLVLALGRRGLCLGTGWSCGLRRLRLTARASRG